MISDRTADLITDLIAATELRHFPEIQRAMAALREDEDPCIWPDDPSAWMAARLTERDEQYLRDGVNR